MHCVGCAEKTNRLLLRLQARQIMNRRRAENTLWLMRNSFPLSLAYKHGLEETNNPFAARPVEIYPADDL